MKKSSMVWEIVAYVGLACCLMGQVMIGKMYLPAQCLYLVSNVSSVVRDFVIKMPKANKVRDICFTAITLALIIIRLAQPVI